MGLYRPVVRQMPLIGDLLIKSRARESLIDLRWAKLLLVIIDILIWNRSVASQTINDYFRPVAEDTANSPFDAAQRDAENRYNANGMFIGNYTIRPDLAHALGYNSNVDGVVGGRGSLLSETTASVRAESTLSRYNTFAFATLDNQRYLDVPSQSFTNWSAGLGGTVVVGRSTIEAQFTHQTLNQLPGAINVLNVPAPVAYRVDTATIGYIMVTQSRFKFEPRFTVAKYDYDNYTVGGTLNDQSYRNRVALQGSLTTRYEIAPQKDALLVLRGTRLIYATAGSNGAPKRDSTGGAVLTGLDFPAPGSNFRFRILAGLQLRQYDSRAYATQSPFIVEASVIWTPTRLTTVTLSARRDIEDAADDSIAGYTFNSVRLSVDHALRRNVLLNAFGEVQKAEFPSSTLNLPAKQLIEAGTAQTIYNTGVGATWLLNSNVRAIASFELSQHSGGGVTSYLSNVTMLTLGFRL